MNSVIETILTRRSIRAFSEKNIEEEKLNQILQAAIYAPSGRNRQTWIFTALLDKEKMRRLAKAIARELGRDEETYDFYNPTALIIPSNDRENPLGADDNACALENIFLAAHSLGIGSVWINQLKGICDAPQIREILRELQIPEEHIVYGMAALGYPAQITEKVLEKTGKIQIIR